MGHLTKPLGRKLERAESSLRWQHTAIGSAVLAATIWLLVMTIVRDPGSYYHRPITVSAASTTPGSSTVAYHFPVLALTVVGLALFSAQRLTIGLARSVRERYACTIVEDCYLAKDETYDVPMVRSVNVMRWAVAGSVYPLVGMALASLAGVTDIMAILLLGVVVLSAIYMLLVFEYLNSRVRRYRNVKWTPGFLAAILSFAYHGVIVTYTVARLVVDSHVVPAQVVVAVFVALFACIVITLLFVFRYTRYNNTKTLREDTTFDMAYTITEGAAAFAIAVALSIP